MLGKLPVLAQVAVFLVLPVEGEELLDALTRPGDAAPPGVVVRFEPTPRAFHGTFHLLLAPVGMAVPRIEDVLAGITRPFHPLLGQPGLCRGIEPRPERGLDVLVRSPGIEYRVFCLGHASMVMDTPRQCKFRVKKFWPSAGPPLRPAIMAHNAAGRASGSAQPARPGRWREGGEPERTRGRGGNGPSRRGISRAARPPGAPAPAMGSGPRPATQALSLASRSASSRSSSCGRSGAKPS